MKIFNIQIKNNLNQIFVLFTVLILFLRYIPDLSFKIIFLSQSFLLFLIYIKNIYLDKKIIPFFLAVLVYPFLTQDLKYFGYILLIILLNLFLKKPERNNFILDDKFFYFFCFLLIILAKSISFNEYFLKEILIDSSGSNFYEKLNVQSHTCFLKWYCDMGLLLASTKYSYFNLDPNYASILILMIYNLFFYENSKKYLINFTIFTVLLIIFTQSKSGIIFYLTLLFFFKFKTKYKNKIIIFLIANLFLFTTSTLFYKNFKNPYEKILVIPTKVHSTPETDAYYDEICNNKKFDKIKYFTDCNKLFIDEDKKNYAVLKIFGMSTYLKLYSVGFSFNDLIYNFNEYLLPESIKKRSSKFLNSKHHLNNNFSAHNILLKGIQNFGFIYLLIFLINIYIFFKKSFNYNFFPTIFSSMFVGMDIFLFTSILALSFKKESLDK